MRLSIENKIKQKEKIKNAQNLFPTLLTFSKSCDIMFKRFVKYYIWRISSVG